MKQRLIGFAAGVACVIVSVHAQAFSNLYIFGDSLSDAGNNALVFGPAAITPVPISGNEFVPVFPYASTHYTNDQIWAQTFARTLGLQANPSLSGGTDFAYGGARTSGPTPLPPIRTLVQQTDDLLSAHPQIPSDALYVVEGGGNNARDAFVDIALNGKDLAQTIKTAAEGYAEDVSGLVHNLENAGARDIVVWDVPDIGRSPALLAEGAQASFLGTVIALSMNVALDVAIRKDPDVKLFDTFAIVDDVAAHPAKFGLTNVTDACAHFTDCDPTKFLFWDGIHPTSAGHDILSDAMLQVVPEPSTYASMLAGLLGCLLLAWGRPRQVRRSSL